jgi:hypothetical protein
VFKYSSRFWLYAPVGLFLLLLAVAMLHWWMVAGAFEKKLAALKGKDAIPGITLDWDKVEVGGFPFRLDANFSNFRLYGLAATNVSWRSEKFALHTLAYDRSKIVFEAAGQQWAQWGQTNGLGHTVSFLPASMHGGSQVSSTGLQRFDLEILNLGDKAFTLDHFQFHLRRDPNRRELDVMLKADGLKSPDAAGENLQIYANLNQVDLLAPLLRGEADWHKTMADWTFQGGRTTFTQVKLPQGQQPQMLLSPLILLIGFY